MITRKHSGKGYCISCDQRRWEKSEGKQRSTTIQIVHRAGTVSSILHSPSLTYTTHSLLLAPARSIFSHSLFRPPRENERVNEWSEWVEKGALTHPHICGCLQEPSSYSWGNDRYSQLNCCPLFHLRCAMRHMWCEGESHTTLARHRRSVTDNDRTTDWHEMCRVVKEYSMRRHLWALLSSCNTNVRVSVSVCQCDTRLCTHLCTTIARRVPQKC